MALKPITLFEDTKAECGNIFRIVWNDGTESGYPSAAIRDAALFSIAAGKA